MSVAVTCKDLKKHYGSKEALVTALRGITLEAYVGELLMLVGPSGCGKTTLLSIISGILHQDEGECRIFDTSLNDLPADQKLAFRAKEIGFVFQSFNLIPMLTAIENTAVPLMLGGMEKEEALYHAAELLKRVGLEKRMFAHPPKMSGGEQQRVAVCRGCIHKPRVIVCDEPTSALDHQTGIQVLELFREIALTQNSSLIIVTHDARIFEFADRMLRMDDGHIVEEQRNGDKYR